MQDATKNVGQVSIKSVGITNQRETTIIWRRSTGKPCYNAIVWLDTRTRHAPGTHPPSVAPPTPAVLTYHTLRVWGSFVMLL